VALTQWIVLALVQAIAETLPVGASAQFAWLDAWAGRLGGGAVAGPDPALALGIRFGLLAATAAYFWESLADMIQGLIRLAKGKRDPGARLAFQLLAGGLPSLAVAVAIDQAWGTAWKTPMLAAWATAGIGVLLLLFDRACMTVKRIEHAGFGDVLLLGCAQACAFVPGVGRMAASAAMARLLGYERRDAAKFAFLLWLPVLAGSGVWHAVLLARQPAAVPLAPVAVGFGVAFLAAVATMAMLMGWLRRRGFTAFAIYRLLLGLNLLAFAYDLI
jgi:undecaprenyl-diphosphatase